MLQFFNFVENDTCNFKTKILWKMYFIRQSLAFERALAIIFKRSKTLGKSFKRQNWTTFLNTNILFQRCVCQKFYARTDYLWLASRARALAQTTLSSTLSIKRAALSLQALKPKLDCINSVYLSISLPITLGFDHPVHIPHRPLT